MKTEILLPVAELKTALPGLSRVVRKTWSLPVLRCLRITRTKTGVVTLSATDLNTFVTFQVPKPNSGPAVVVLVLLDCVLPVVKRAQPGDPIGFIVDGAARSLRSFVAQTPFDEKFESFAPEEWPPEPNVPAPSFAVDRRFKSPRQGASERPDHKA